MYKYGLLPGALLETGMPLFPVTHTRSRTQLVPLSEPATPRYPLLCIDPIPMGRFSRVYVLNYLDIQTG